LGTAQAEADDAELLPVQAVKGFNTYPEAKADRRESRE